MVGAIGLAVNSSAAWPYDVVSFSTHFGTSKQDWGNRITVDSVGNIYITGGTYGNLAAQNLGSVDSILVKCDSSGNVLWSQQTGSKQLDYAGPVAVDAASEVYTINWCPSACLSKYDGSGGKLWSQSIDHGDGTLAITTSGYAYTSASSYSVGTSLAKYDGAGINVWTQNVSPSRLGSVSVASDAAGNAYICGSDSGTTVIAKYDSAGGRLWAQRIGELGITSMATDAAGNIYLGSGYDDEANYLYKYSSSGHELWSSPLPWTCASLTANASGSVCMLAYTKTFDHIAPDETIFYDYDYICVVFDENDYVNDLSANYVSGMALDAAGNLYVTGMSNNDVFLTKYQVPEPATLSLLAIGGFAMLRRRRKM